MNKLSSIKFRIEWTFWLSAFILLLIIIGFTIFAINFLVQEINLVLGGDLSSGPAIIRFDFEKANQILSGRPGTTPE